MCPCACLTPLHGYRLNSGFSLSVAPLGHITIAQWANLLNGGRQDARLEPKFIQWA
jgi:hypothetical protein